MKRPVISVAVLLALLLLGSTSLAEAPGKIWRTEFTSDVFTFDSPGFYEYTYDFTDLQLSYTVEVAEEALAYEGAALLRPWTVRARTDEPGLDCADVDALIQLGQPVRFHVFLVTGDEMTHQEAEDLWDTASVTVLWGDEAVSLERQAIYLDREDVDWVDVSCIWTVRP